MLKDVGVDRICVIVDHQSNLIRGQLNGYCEYIENPDYQTTNSLYSLWMARKWVKKSFLMINGDVLAHPDVYKQLIQSSHSAVAFDSTSGDDEEHMKVRFSEGGQLVDIAKHLSCDRNHGESLGLIKFCNEGTERVFDLVDGLLDEGDAQNWAAAALKQLAKEFPVRGIDVAGLPWAEIDFPEDMDYAQRSIWPAINKHLNAA